MTPPNPLREKGARILAEHLASGVTGTPDDRGMDDCDDFNSKHPMHRQVYYDAIDAILAVLPESPDPDDLAKLDAFISLFDAMAGLFSEDFYDDAWNLRNKLVPFVPGDEHYDSVVDENLEYFPAPPAAGAGG